MYSFGNLILGPVIGIDSLEQKQSILNDLLDKTLIVTAFITDVEHPVFKEFSENNKDFNPVAIFVTIQYKYYFE